MPTVDDENGPVPHIGHEFHVDPSAGSLRYEAGDQTAAGRVVKAFIDADADSFSFDPNDHVDFGHGDPEAGRVAWEKSRHAALDAFRREAEVRKASGGPPYLGWFLDEAIPASKGRYRFGIDREQLLAAVTHLRTVANRPKGSKPIVPIALRPDLCKLTVTGPQYGLHIKLKPLRDLVYYPENTL